MPKLSCVHFCFLLRIVFLVIFAVDVDNFSLARLLKNRVFRSISSKGDVADQNHIRSHRAQHSETMYVFSIFITWCSGQGPRQNPLRPVRGFVQRSINCTCNREWFVTLCDFLTTWHIRIAQKVEFTSCVVHSVPCVPRTSHSLAGNCEQSFPNGN